MIETAFVVRWEKLLWAGLPPREFSDEELRSFLLLFLFQTEFFMILKLIDLVLKS